MESLLFDGVVYGEDQIEDGVYLDNCEDDDRGFDILNTNDCTIYDEYEV